MHTFFIRLCAALLCFGLSVRPAQAVPDIADFFLGMTREDTLLRATSPCGDKLCGQVSFGGKIWGASFRFQDDALDVISLFGPPRDEYVEAAFSAFADSPYVVYRVVGDQTVFDFPSQAAEGLSPEALDAAFGDFLRALGGAGGSFASFFYTEPAVYAALKREAMEAGTGKTSKKAAESAARPGEPAPRSDGVVCALTVAGDGIVILILTRRDLEAELTARAASESRPGRRAE